ncbi:MAG: hypothetical protein P8J87_11970 [Verrucomicrobiales bacterium]|nr:hypothetical protein [Verrucomicrobiales bacterium]
MQLTRSGWVGLVVAGISTLGLLLFFMEGGEMASIEVWQRGNEKPLVVEAWGENRAWHFTYRGSDQKWGTDDDLVSKSYLTLPANAKVELRLRSRDYIYVFSCPDLGLKEIAVPDIDFSLDFETGEEAEFTLAMDPMCGFRLPPGKTMGKLRISGDRAFRRWLLHLRSEPAPHRLPSKP